MELQITVGADVKLCVEVFRLGCLPCHGVVELYAVVRGSEPTQLGVEAMARPSIFRGGAVCDDTLCACENPRDANFCNGCGKRLGFPPRRDEDSSRLSSSSCLACSPPELQPESGQVDRVAASRGTQEAPHLSAQKTRKDSSL